MVVRVHAAAVFVSRAARTSKSLRIAPFRAFCISNGTPFLISPSLRFVASLFEGRTFHRTFGVFGYNGHTRSSLFCQPCLVARVCLLVVHKMIRLHLFPRTRLSVSTKGASGPAVSTPSAVFLSRAYGLACSAILFRSAEKQFGVVCHWLNRGSFRTAAPLPFGLPYEG
jgi:hypothetical protein